MHGEPGDLDEGRWLKLWGRLGAEGTGHSLFAHLTAAYAEPGRAYHTARHICDCLVQLDSVRDMARRPDEVEAALWFHDAVYLPGGSDNEERSAALAETSLLACDVPRGVAQRIAQQVLATRHVTFSDDPDTQLLCDIDLSILGREPAVFDGFERCIRQEYDWVPEPIYQSSRIEILAGFLRRRSIYQTEEFRGRCEAPARANLERLIKKLGGTI